MVQAATRRWTTGWWLVAGMLVLAGSPAHAETVGRAPLVPAVTAADHAGDVELVAKKKRSRAAEQDTPDFPLKGDLAWVLAGSAGAAFSLLFFAVPFFWLAWAGPFFVGPWVLGIAWAFVVIGAGGVLAWLVSALFSEIRSGVLLPALVSGGVGAGITALAGLVSVMVWFSYAAGMIFIYGPTYNPFNPHYWGPGYGWGVYSLAGAAAFLVWVTGVVAASIAGPLLGAYLYRTLGVPKTDKEFHVDLLTPARE